MEGSSWEIRTAAPADVAGLLELWCEAGSVPTVTDSPALTALLGHDPEAVIVAVAAGAPIGSLIAAWDGWRGSFYRLAVAPGERRRGLATALVREGERRLRGRRAVRLTAIVDATETEALAFWAAIGYERQHDRSRFVRVFPA